MPAPTTQQPERQTREAEPLMMRAAVVPSSIDEGARTVDVTWSTGSDVERRDLWTGERFTEALSMDPKSVRLGRLNGGAPVLDAHGAYSTRSVLGVVESARIEGGKGVATVRFSSRADVEPIWQDVRSGILRSISVGYAVHKWDVKRSAEGKLEKRTAVDWEPYEVSIVPIPADPGAQIRAYEDDVAPAPAGAERKDQMADEQTPGNAQRGQETPATPAPVASPQPAGPTADEVRALERSRVTAIDDLCRIHGVATEKRSAWLGSDVSIDSVRSAILDDIGERQRATHITPGNGQREMSMVRDASDALLLRAGLKVEGDGHRNFAGGSLIRMAEIILAAGGVNTRTLDRDEIAKRALATIDFSTILDAVGQKTTRKGYDSVPLVHRDVFRRASAVDFRNRNIPSVAAGQTLEEVPEGGPIPRRTVSKEMASYALKNYGGITPVTRKLIINDDFELIARITEQQGRAAAETERQVFWTFVNSNPNAPDGVACFHSDHANTTTASSGLGVTAVTLGAARKAMRDQTATDGTSINVALKHIVCGTATETAWDQLINGIVMPTAFATGMTPNLRATMVHVEPLVSGEDWYAFADYNQCDTFEFAYLAGKDGPRVETRNGFDVEGIEIKCVLDFGVGCIDQRGAYWMNGA